MLHWLVVKVVRLYGYDQQIDERCHPSSEVLVCDNNQIFPGVNDSDPLRVYREDNIIKFTQIISYKKNETGFSRQMTLQKQIGYIALRIHTIQGIHYQLQAIQSVRLLVAIAIQQEEMFGYFRRLSNSGYHGLRVEDTVKQQQLDTLQTSGRDVV